MRDARSRLERVVLGRDLVVVELADEGDLLQDVGLHARDAVEEEDREDAGRDAEGGADGAPAMQMSVGVRLLLWRDRVVRGVHSGERGGREAAELDLGDRVAGARGLVSHWVFARGTGRFGGWVLTSGRTGS